jgi:acetyltransferase-like isoleucine patch superfamily enzyme/dTDP-4-dehydrorhamnose 3,5-epimerase-like enzyme
MKPFIHPQALCESRQVGEGSRIWAFAHVLPGACIGRDCNICDHVFIENDVVLGDRVTVKCGVQLWDGLSVGDDVFLGPNATFTNDKFPRSKQYQAVVPRTLVADGASIGANATILPGIRIGSHAMIGAGSVVTRDVPPNAIVTGNPARISGYVDACRWIAPEKALPVPPPAGMLHSRVQGVSLHSLKEVGDLRGQLSVGNFEDDIPFAVQRYFVVYDVPGENVRGEHAHRTCHQFLVCVKGSVAVIVDDGSCREEIVLDRPALGVYIPPMIWCVQYEYSADATLLVFASHRYDANDYIRDYDEFLRLVQGRDSIIPRAA